MATTPSIAMIPSGYKDEKVYSVLPTNGDGDFTFARTTIATRVNSNGLIEEVGINKPRLDYSDGACPSLLLEPISTNLYTYSDDLTDSDWSKDNSRVEPNQIASPDGSVISDELIEDLATTNHSIRQLKSITNGNYYTTSVFVKESSNKRDVYIRCGDANILVYFDTTNWEVGDEVQGSGKIENYGNGWYRLIATGLASSTGSDNFRFGLSNGTTNASQTYTGNGVNSMYFYGAQVEEQSYATSYIKTEGTVITRAAESATGSGDATVINSTEGTLYFEGNAFSSTGSSGLISLNVGTTDLNNRVTIELDGANVKARFAIGGTSLGVFNYATDITQVLKIAVKYKANDFALWVNGTERVPLTSGNSFSANTLSQLDFNRGDGQEPFIGNTNDLRVYATALSDEELITLTTI